MFAFDIDPRARAITKKVADFNDRRSQVIVGDVCNHEILQKIAIGRTLVISDCEGYEVTLLNPQMCPALFHFDLLVELHEFINPLAGDLIELFRHTHQVQVVTSISRTLEDFPFANSKWPMTFKRFSMDEFRPFQMRWLWCKAKSPSLK